MWWILCEKKEKSLRMLNCTGVVGGVDGDVGGDGGVGVVWDGGDGIIYGWCGR